MQLKLCELLLFSFLKNSNMHNVKNSKISLLIPRIHILELTTFYTPALSTPLLILVKYFKENTRHLIISLQYTSVCIFKIMDISLHKQNVIITHLKTDQISLFYTQSLGKNQIAPSKKD